LFFFILNQFKPHVWQKQEEVQGTTETQPFCLCDCQFMSWRGQEGCRLGAGFCYSRNQMSVCLIQVGHSHTVGREGLSVSLAVCAEPQLQSFACIFGHGIVTK